MNTRAAEAPEPGDDEHIDHGPDGGDDQAAIEQQAREYGWTPIDQWKGNKEFWKPADEYLRRMQKHPGVVRERERGDKLEQEVGELKTRLEESGNELKGIKDTLGSFVEQNRKAAQSAYERGLADAKKRRDKAAMSGDTEAYQEASAEVERLEQEADTAAPPPPSPPSPPPPPPPPAEKPKISPVAQSWIDGNQRIMQDPVLFSVAEEIHRNNMAGGMSEADSFEGLAAEVRKRVPYKFKNPARAAPGSVTPPGAPPTPPKKNGYDALPADVKKVCDRQVADINRAKPAAKYTNEEWAADYWASQGVNP